MARLPRYDVLGCPQHVIQRGNNHCAMFAAEPDCEFFLERLRLACARYECQVHAYVLMTNHVHLLMTPQKSGAISRVMQSVGRCYVHRFNLAHKRTGTLWEGRFRAAPIENERYLLTCYRYIELNPVRAGLVQSPQRYRWSSHGANAHGQNDSVISPHPTYLTLGRDPETRQAEYRALFRTHIDDASIQDIREATQRGCPLISVHLRQQLVRLRSNVPAAHSDPISTLTPDPISTLTPKRL
jgi:putative transposase